MNETKVIIFLAHCSLFVGVPSPTIVDCLMSKTNHKGYFHYSSSDPILLIGHLNGFMCLSGIVFHPVQVLKNHQCFGLTVYQELEEEEIETYSGRPKYAK